jgi:hypothetical protein
LTTRATSTRSYFAATRSVDLPGALDIDVPGREDDERFPGDGCKSKAGLNREVLVILPTTCIDKPGDGDVTERAIAEIATSATAPAETGRRCSVNNEPRHA